MVRLIACMEGSEPQVVSVTGRNVLNWPISGVVSLASQTNNSDLQSSEMRIYDIYSADRELKLTRIFIYSSRVIHWCEYARLGSQDLTRP